MSTLDHVGVPLVPEGLERVNVAEALLAPGVRVRNHVLPFLRNAAEADSEGHDDQDQNWDRYDQHQRELPGEEEHSTGRDEEHQERPEQEGEVCGERVSHEGAVGGESAVEFASLVHVKELDGFVDCLGEELVSHVEHDCFGYYFESECTEEPEQKRDERTHH